MTIQDITAKLEQELSEHVKKIEAEVKDDHDGDRSVYVTVTWNRTPAGQLKTLCHVEIEIRKAFGADACPCGCPLHEHPFTYISHRYKD